MADRTDVPDVLIEPRFAPVTFSAGFLELPLDAVVEGVRAWYHEMKLHRALQAAANLPFTTALAQLEPLSAPDFRRLWVATASPRWRTAYFDGFINGTDAGPPIGYLAQRLGCHGLTVGSQPDAPPCSGATHIALYGPETTDWLNLEWSVSAMNDGGRWTFSRTGVAQPFEEPEHYTRRRIRERFTPELLRRYCSALEVPLDGAAFGRSVLDVPTFRATIQRRETLAKVRATLGLTALSQEA